MIADGLLAADDRVQLLEGEVVRMAPKGPWHVYAVAEVADQLAAMRPAGWHIRRQDPITLADSEPEPDVVITRGTKRRYRGRHPRADEVGLVVEVAEATLLLDRHRKAAIYAAAGIPEYWIVNLADRQLEIHTKPQPAGSRRLARYANRRVVGEKGSLTPALDGKSIGAIAVADLLP
jgi:Uma2 family endonuclease